VPRHSRLFLPGATYHVYCRVARGEFVFETRQDQPSECLLRPVGPAGHQLAAVDPDAVGTVALVQHELASVGRGYQAEGVLGLHLRMIRSPGFMKNAVVESVA
jgi:hypothetical protein